MSVYYNDSEPFVCDWLENLIREKLLPAGVVDRRPIQEVEPQDVQGFTQCHFFAGIGGWAYALQLANWGDRPVWTGSCPCQPFSAAGQRKAGADERHLWPAWFRLIRECRPERVFGEQVAGAIGHGWLDLVSTDLEAEAYTFGAVVLGAHSVGAPHGRQRIWFVADRECPRLEGHAWHGANGHQPRRIAAAAVGPIGAGRLCAPVADSEVESERAGLRARESSRERRGRSGDSGSALPDASGERLGRGAAPTGWQAGATDEGLWATEPNVGRVAHGVPARMGRLRAYGNAIVPQVAAAFVRAYMDVCES